MGAKFLTLEYSSFLSRVFSLASDKIINKSKNVICNVALHEIAPIHPQQCIFEIMRQMLDADCKHTAHSTLEGTLQGA
jgi:hypothetical protein